MADLHAEAEPVYPVQALVAGEIGRQAEAKWWNDVLIWGRTHHDRVQRICRWAKELKADVPEGWCG